MGDAVDTGLLRECCPPEAAGRFHLHASRDCMGHPPVAGAARLCTVPRGNPGTSAWGLPFLVERRPTRLPARSDERQARRATPTHAGGEETVLRDCLSARPKGTVNGRTQNRRGGRLPAYPTGGKWPPDSRRSGTGPSPGATSHAP